MFYGGAKVEVFWCTWWLILHPEYILQGWRGYWMWRYQMWECWHPMESGYVCHWTIILYGWDLLFEGNSWHRCGSRWQCVLLERLSNEWNELYLFQVCLKYLVQVALIYQKNFASTLYDTYPFWGVLKIQGIFQFRHWWLILKDRG